MIVKAVPVLTSETLRLAKEANKLNLIFSTITYWKFKS